MVHLNASAWSNLHQFFFTTNSLGGQPTTSQYFQPLAQQTLALAATAIHCALSDYASGKKATVMFSQDEYRGTFCPSSVLHITLEATALIINHIIVGRLIPPLRHNSTSIDAPQSPLALLCLDWCCSISFPIRFPPAHLGLDCCFNIVFPAP